VANFFRKLLLTTMGSCLTFFVYNLFLSLTSPKGIDGFEEILLALALLPGLFSFILWAFLRWLFPPNFKQLPYVVKAAALSLALLLCFSVVWNLFEISLPVYLLSVPVILPLFAAPEYVGPTRLHWVFVTIFITFVACIGAIGVFFLKVFNIF
jgi:hypothetical protein